VAFAPLAGMRHSRVHLVVADILDMDGVRAAAEGTTRDCHVRFNP
jgi:hypothetical protein